MVPLFSPSLSHKQIGTRDSLLCRSGGTFFTLLLLLTKFNDTLERAWRVICQNGEGGVMREGMARELDS